MTTPHLPHSQQPGSGTPLSMRNARRCPAKRCRGRGERCHRRPDRAAPAEIAKKIEQIEDYLRVGGNALFDNRVERILDSIKRDLRALARRAGAA